MKGFKKESQNTGLAYDWKVILDKEVDHKEVDHDRKPETQKSQLKVSFRTEYDDEGEGRAQDIGYLKVLLLRQKEIFTTICSLTRTQD